MTALEEIFQRHPVWRGAAPGHPAGVVSTGYPALDAELPGGGWPAGALTEVLADEHGIGELQLLLPALAALTAAGRRMVWLAPPYLPYPPALAAAGIDLAHLAMVRAPGRGDALWAAEQVLRSGSCHALLAWFARARYAELQRLAVSAESSRACAFLFRPCAAARESSPACLRLALEPGGAELGVRILKRRGAPAVLPLRLPMKLHPHALGRPAFSIARPRHARVDRRLGLPVHA